MSTSFPNAIDSFTNPVGTDQLNKETVPHATQHSDANDAIEAIETLLFKPSREKFYAVYCSTQTQTLGAVGVGQPITFNTLESNQDITVSGSNITIPTAGVYNIQFSAQLDRTGGGVDNAYIWLRKNGVDVPRSNTVVTVSGNAGAAKIVAAWNFVVTVTAGDVFQLYWTGTHSTIELLSQAYDSLPLIPSVILTVTPVF